MGRNWARVHYARHVEPTWLELTRHQIAIRNLNPAHDGFRIVHLTDFHASRRVSAAYLRESVELANSLSPDVIALTGDFVHCGYRHVEHVADILGRLSARHGVYAVLGNHDFSVRNPRGFRRHRELHNTVAEALEDRGVRLLRNRCWSIQHDSSPLHLVGVDDLWSGDCDLGRAFADLPADAPCLVLAHNPVTIERLNGRRCDLMLSGHTHGGQVNWPGVGRIFLGRDGRRFCAGLYRHGDSHLYVNRGVGYGLRLRFGVRPEVALLELRRAP